MASDDWKSHQDSPVVPKGYLMKLYWSNRSNCYVQILKREGQRGDYPHWTIYRDEDLRIIEKREEMQGTHFSPDRDLQRVNAFPNLAYVLDLDV